MTPNPPMTITDPRFKNLHTDPRFLRPSKRVQQKVIEEDERFQTVTKSKKKSTVSKRKSNGDTQPNPSLVDLARGQVLLESSDEEESEIESEKEKVYFDSDEDDSDEDDSDSDEELELGGPSRKSTHSGLHVDLDESRIVETSIKEPINGIEPTKRIAVVNLDWDHVKPIDLYKVFSSLLSTTAPSRSSLLLDPENGSQIKKQTKHVMVKGQVVKVSIYKSQFGKEQMSKEDVEGPPRELFKDTSRPIAASDDESSDEELLKQDEGGEFDEEALRRYQLNRLRYYYAVIELDSVDAAAHVYEEIEGTEFERTANIFDLSYVPQDMEFDEADLHDECKEDTVNYKGVDYATDALRHSKVKLTWDAEDPHRTKVTRLNTQKMTREELDELDFRAFVAPPSSDEDEETAPEDVGDRAPKQASSRSKLRDLLGLTQLGTSTAQDGPELDITFVPAFGRKPDGSEPSSHTFPTGSNPTENKSTKLDKSTDSHVDRRYESTNSIVDESKESSKKARRRKQEEKTTKVESHKSSDADSDHREKPSGEAELALLFDTNEDLDPTRAHFDLTQIVKAEKLKGRSKALKRIKHSQKEEVLRDDRFEINTTDDRFKMVYDDHEFAIDPSNPQYKKTKNMTKLLEAARSQRTTEGELEPSGKTLDRKDKSDANLGDRRLDALVASLKKPQADSHRKRKR